MGDPQHDGFSALFYPGTQTLINLYNERDPQKLARLERDIVSAADLAARLISPIKGHFDLEHMQAIHRHLFGEIYPWAGELRTYQIFKQRPDGMTTEFARPAEFTDLNTELKKAVATLATAVPQKLNEFVNQVANIYRIANELHPFREGNGRTHRLFLDGLAEQAGYRLHFDKVDPAAWNYAASMSGQISIGAGERIPGRTDELRTVFAHISTRTAPSARNAYLQGREGIAVMQDRPALTLKDLNPGLASYGARHRIR